MKRSISIAGYCSAGFIMLVMIITGMDRFDIVAAGNFFYGADYLPAVWVALAAIFPLILFIAAKNRISALIMGAAVMLYFAVLGDYSLASLFPPRRQQQVPAAKVTVAALNVQYYTQGVKTVMQGIRLLNADVVLISENDLPDSVYRSLQNDIAPMQLRMGHKNSTAILSRFPILEFHEIELPSYEASLSGGNDVKELSANPHRSFVHAVLGIAGVKVNVISIRFIAGRPKKNTLEENLRWGKYLVNVQMQEVETFMRYINTLHGPIIFGGDLNAPPFSKPMRKIEYAATDAFMASHVWGQCTFRTDLPKLRLDYLFCMNGVVPGYARCPALFVSDHFPIVSDFWIPVTADDTNNHCPGFVALPR